MKRFAKGIKREHDGGADGHILPSQPPATLSQGFHDVNYTTTTFPGTQAPTPVTIGESTSGYPDPYTMSPFGGFGPESLPMGHGGPPHGGHADPLAAGRSFVPSIHANMRHLTGRDIIQFGSVTNLDLEDMDFNLLGDYNEMFMSSLSGHGSSMHLDPLNPPQAVSPTSSLEPPTFAMKQLALGRDAYQRSHLRWNPTSKDHANNDQTDLAVPSDASSRIKMHWRAIRAKLDQQARDRVLAVILTTCEFHNRLQAVSSFPSAELLDNLVNVYFHHQRQIPDAWVHPATFHPNTAAPDLLAAVVAAGAVLTPVRTIRKLGFALQEAVRTSIPRLFESNNAYTRNLEIVSSFMLWLEVSLWSGHKRRIEIAESFRNVLTTMLRRGGKFRRSQYPPIYPTPSDTGEVLEAKWREWAAQQQWLRLAYHLMIHDAQASISLLINPVISYAELSLPLPAGRDLFFAPTAEEWKTLYISNPISPETRIPSFTDCIHDFPGLSLPPDITSIHIDHELTELATLFGLWGQLWDYRQRLSIRRYPQQRPPSPLLQHIKKNLLNPRFQSPHCRLLLELLGMSVYVSLEELQAFAGKEDEEESLRVLPIVQAWIQSSESRLAAWHAGQLIREARTIRLGGLNEFWAVAVYHASLTLWAYAVLRKMVVTPVTTPDPLISEAEELVYLDGVDTQASDRFIEFNRGHPTICGFHPQQRDIDVHSPCQVMRGVAEFMRGNHALGNGGETTPPPIVENLTQLMEELGDLAEERI